MTQNLRLCCIFLLCLLVGKVHGSASAIHHRLDVRLNPAEQSLQVTDTVELKQSGSHQFMLHAGLQPKVLSDDVNLLLRQRIGGKVPLELYQVDLPAGKTGFTLQYAGKIAHDFDSRLESPGRRQQTLAGTISAQGVFLDGGVAWYPVFPERLQQFSLRVQLPDAWFAISQGEGPVVQTGEAGRQISWHAATPQDDIYLIAGAYTFYQHDAEVAQAQVFLRQADAQLAERYLRVTRDYLQLYSELIGPYAYPKFALVENFWETGYGMPSFTLLGSRVIRLPFILHTSYPHEILHNWWGNGVFVDYASGNWSEGLTTYLADHLLKEQRGQGVEYRRSALQRYQDFVRSANDFSLSQFRSRHSGSSQAIGYDKSLMFYHMLRRKLGDEAFIKGLRLFYKSNLFRTAGFADLQAAFAQVSQQDLSGFFQQWLQRTGAPAIAVKNVQLTEDQQNGFELSGELLQTQIGLPFQIDVPMIAYGQNNEAMPVSIALAAKKQAFRIKLPFRPVRLDVDPWFDVFRQLDDTEAPPVLSKIFGSEQVLFVLPSQAPDDLLAAYRELAQQWSEGYAKADIRLDSSIDALPGDRPVWLLGWQNRFFKGFQESLDQGQFAARDGQISLSGHDIDRSAQSLILTRRNPATQHIVAWLGSDLSQALPRLARKVPHYGKYSYLSFDGERSDNRHKGQWPVSNSPLRVMLSDDSSAVKEQQLAPLWKP
ncbi:MAG: M1 family aminopeptidase [Chromatiales bacterium]|jgi:hypothetical protein